MALGKIILNEVTQMQKYIAWPLIYADISYEVNDNHAAIHRTTDGNLEGAHENS